MKILSISLMLTLYAGDCFALEKIFTTYCSNAGVPKELAIAIARQESSLNPWSINIQGRDYTPKTYNEAVKLITEAHRQGKSYDVGIMQVNCQWTKKWKIDPLILLDPSTNIKLGLKILKQEIDKHGLNWIAVGKYHSPQKERGRKYAWRVFKRLNGGINAKTLFTAKQKTYSHFESISDNRGIFRSSGVKRKGRLITFGVREESLPGKPDSESGRSTGTEGAS